MTEADLKRVEARIRSINKFTPIQRCQQSEVSVDGVLNIKGFDLKRTLEIDPEFPNTDGEHKHYSYNLINSRWTVANDSDGWAIIA